VYSMSQDVQMDIKDVKLNVDKNLKDLGIEGSVRIASAKFHQGYWDIVVFHSKDIEIEDKKQKKE
jgi:hypothetical protein